MTHLVNPLESALIANGIHVPQGAIVQLIEQTKWIYVSERVEKLLEEITEQQLYNIFSEQHHLQASILLFQFLQKMKKKVAVVYGHKAQGKTQFLFFVFKLLQAMGEKVIFLDKTILPLDYDELVFVKNQKFCGNWWSESFLQIGGIVKNSLKAFYDDNLPRSFGKFLKALMEFSISSGLRVWIIVDEVVLFDDFPIQLPSEQDLGSFHWVITGSAGIGSWVSQRHLETHLFDLHLFTKEECLALALKLCDALKISLEENIGGVTDEGIADWLEERFGGIAGYVVEMCLEFGNGNSVSNFMSILSERIQKLVNDLAKRRHISNKQLAEDWLNEMKSVDNSWFFPRDAGLCGRFSPRGMIFSFILRWLFTFAPEENVLALVHRFRCKFHNDPGLDGCLLEMEEIFKIKENQSIAIALLTLVENSWVMKECAELPALGISNELCIFQYVEQNNMLDAISKLERSRWNMIEVPYSFDVIDVVLVDASPESPAIYGIQITRSNKPFAKHHSLETCSLKSKQRLQKLWDLVFFHFQLDRSTSIFFVMLAPNCEKDQFIPPFGHSSDFFFAPSFKINTSESNLKKRKPQGHSISLLSSTLGNKKCCACKSRKCTSCQCAKKKKLCDAECGCQNT
jgi:hypothetical protein